MKTVKAPSAGMTLIELLVAFMVLIMLVVALVTLTTRSLETWTTGEARKDTYDRAQGVLEMIASDLRNLYAENEFFNDGKNVLMPPVLACDLDKSRQPRIRFVRTGNPAAMRTGSAKPTMILPVTYYTPAWEVAYVMHPDPAKRHELWRGVRPYDRKNSGTLLRPSDKPAFIDNLTQVESGILYVGYKFWTQFTTTWDDGVSLQRVAAKSTQPSGPEKRWDSMRREDRDFFFYRKRADFADPDFVYPEIVEITVTVSSSESFGVKLMDGIDERATTLRLSHTRGIADGPGLVQVDGEWIEYGEKGDTELVKVRRGQRSSAVVAHTTGAPVHFGETFTTEVRIPTFREAQDQ
jgi:hypothetical protein